MAYAATPDRGSTALVRRASSAQADEDAHRSREFQRARRHSGRVRILKGLLPAIALAILSLYILPAFLTTSIDNGRGTASVKAITVEAGSLKMIEPHVRGVNEQQDAYDFTADTATQASKNASVMFLDKVRGKMTSPDGKVTTLTAPNAIHDNKAYTMTFENGAVVVREPGMKATFRTATAFMKEQRVEAKTPVIVQLYESTINADTMVLKWSEQRTIFEGNVKTHIERQPETAASSPTKPAAPIVSAGAWAPESRPIEGQR
jgi:lipopolysaccharide export system protein LptC